MQETYQKSEKLYLLPIGGTAMATLAGLLKEAGHDVEGVDVQLYPPMSTLLEDLDIPVREGFDPSSIPQDIDRVIIGNAVPFSNPEVEAVLRAKIPYISQAEAVAHYLLAGGRQSLVVAGTHGKTTTSSLLAWILEDNKTDPSYLVGGLLKWNNRSFRLGQGRYMVIEGDEYNTAFFDRGPKFLHYRPHLFLLGPVEFDHADIYRDLDAVLTAFRAGTAQVPPRGRVIVNAFSEPALEASRAASAEVITVGPPGSDLAFETMTSTTEGMKAQLSWQGETFLMTIPLAGEYNAHNAAMALAAALHLGLERQRVLTALARFPGVARRLDTIGEHGGILVVDDFAHHPTALAATLAGARNHWPGRRLVVAYEPRSLSSSRKFFQPAYIEALANADVVLVAPIYHRDRAGSFELLDRGEMLLALEQRGVVVVMPGDGEDPVTSLLPFLCPGDVVIGCSSGAFDDFHKRLLEKLS